MLAVRKRRTYLRPRDQGVNMKKGPKCHTLPKALDFSRNIPITSWPSSKDLEISYVLDNS